jgi:serine/threonine protein phosphatase PrpC
MSGTTAITAFFQGAQMTVANIGDSRGIIGEQQGSRTVAQALSTDQTPYRKDERERCKAAGAVVMTSEQLEGTEPMHEDWDVNLGEELDDNGDPPRLWKDGEPYPGVAFTRSIGDAVAETIGVYAEPEVLVRQIGTSDKCVVLASDGVWEFITNQTVCDMVLSFADPLDAAKSVVAEAYRLWMMNEGRTDDITCIVGYVESNAAPPTAPAEPGAAASPAAAPEGGEAPTRLSKVMTERRSSRTVDMFPAPKDGRESKIQPSPEDEKQFQEDGVEAAPATELAA